MRRGSRAPCCSSDGTRAGLPDIGCSVAELWRGVRRRCGRDRRRPDVSWVRQRAARPSTRDDVAASPAPFVSLARCDDMTVGGRSMVGPVGVDVERRRAAGFDGFAGVVLHPAERCPWRRERAVVWMRKESLLKATGQGPDASTSAAIRVTGTGEPPGCWPGRRPTAELPQRGWTTSTSGSPATPLAVTVAGGRPAELRPGRQLRRAPGFHSHGVEELPQTSDRELPRRRSMNMAVVDRAVGVGRRPRARGARRSVVAEGQPQGVQQQRAALVDPVVEHVVRARVAEQQVLVERRRAASSGARRALVGADGSPDSSDQSHSA